MNDSELPSFVDGRLRVQLKHEKGWQFLLGNPHTFPGRIEVWHQDGYSFSISKSDISEMSDEAAVWLDGFLCGAEPNPPFTEDAVLEAEWKASRDRFRATGSLE